MFAGLIIPRDRDRNVLAEKIIYVNLNRPRLRQREFEGGRGIERIWIILFQLEPGKCRRHIIIIIVIGREGDGEIGAHRRGRWRDIRNGHETAGCAVAVRVGIRYRGEGRIVENSGKRISGIG